MQKLSDLRKNDTKANKSNASIISLYNLCITSKPLETKHD